MQRRSAAKTVDEEEADSEFDDGLDTLRVYSLITATVDSDVWEMHALVQFRTRVWLSSISDTERWKRKFVALMAREFPTGSLRTGRNANSYFRTLNRYMAVSRPASQ